MLAILGLVTGLSAAENFAARIRAADRLDQQGEFAQAAALLEATLRDGESYPRTEAQFAIALNNLGNAYESQAKYLEAESNLRRAIDIGERFWVREKQPLLQFYVNLSTLYLESRQYDKVERLGVRELARSLLAMRANDIYAGRMFSTVGVLDRIQRNYGESELYEKEALPIFERADPMGSALVGILGELAVLYREMGRMSESLAYFERAQGIADSALGPNHPIQVNLLANVGAYYLSSEGAAKAEPYYKRALALAEVRYGPDHPKVGEILGRYSVVLERLNRKRQAKEFRLRAEAIERSAARDNPKEYTVDAVSLFKAGGKQ